VRRTLLLLLQLAGDVIGMALLFGALAWRDGPSLPLRESAQNLLQHLRCSSFPPE
jgi:putative effector of murein hydrolase LrgA (UPF0299 family)